jgi:hypothetical protein
MRTPWRAYSSAADLVNAITPALAAAYNACGTPLRPLTEEVLTIAPPRGSCASICRIWCCRHNQTLFRLSAGERSELTSRKGGSRHERFFYGRSIVKRAIQAAPGVHRRLDQRMDIGGLGDVERDEQRRLAGGFDLAPQGDRHPSLDWPVGATPRGHAKQDYSRTV